jgi:hypothetical protein
MTQSAKRPNQRAIPPSPLVRSSNFTYPGMTQNVELNVHFDNRHRREGYQALLKIAQEYNGAFLCDGVGLGKTFVGLMLIEGLVLHDRLNVALFVPKSAHEAVWKAPIWDRLPHVWSEIGGLRIFNHPGLLRVGTG